MLRYLNVQEELVKHAQEIYYKDQRTPWNEYGNKYYIDLEKLNAYIKEFFGYKQKERATEKEDKGANYQGFCCSCCCILILSSVTISVRMFTTPYNSSNPPARSEIAFAKLL